MGEATHYLPMRLDGFIRREIDGAAIYCSSAFEQLTWLSHGFSTRRGGMNLDGSSGANRRRLAHALQLESCRFATLHQIHSNKVYIIEDVWDEWNPPEGDALATAVPNVALAVKAADCLPILIVDPMKRAVAAVHSGWRGTLAGIVPGTIRELQRVYGSVPEDLLLAVGPGIRKCCFEVGKEVADLFENRFPDVGLSGPVNNSSEKRVLDLVKAVELQALSSGVRQENCHDLDACTKCNPTEFFSYRAEGTAAGRMMAAIAVVGDPVG